MNCDMNYLAGFFDGEGCVMFSTGKDLTCGTVRVEVSNTYLPALEMLKETFGGTVDTCLPRENSRTCYRWRVTGFRARCALRSIAPFLREKQEQALLALEIAKEKPADRPEMVKELRALKRKDSHA